MAVARKFIRNTILEDGVLKIALADGSGYIPIVRSNNPFVGLSRPELVSVAYKVLGGSGHAKVTDPVLTNRIWSALDCDYVKYLESKGEAYKYKEETVADEEVSTRNSDDDDIRRVLQDFKKLLGASQIDEQTIARIVEEKVKEHVARPIVVQVGEHEPVKVEGPVHFKFESLLRKMSARSHLFLTGPAGTGKSTLLKHLAKALGLEYRILSAKPLPQDYDVFGFLNTATGKKVLGFVEYLYEHGGVFCLDEVDTGHVSLMTSMNQLLAQDEFDFPCEVNGVRKVQRHPDFMVLATGNTYGQGGSLRYVGTNKINGASLDRFTFVNIPTDEALEKAICDGIDPMISTQVIPIVRKARANCDRYGLDYMVTPRCAIEMVKFIKAGDTLREAADGRLFGRGLNADQESKLLEGISF